MSGVNVFSSVYNAKQKYACSMRHVHPSTCMVFTGIYLQTVTCIVECYLGCVSD
jgi:hypothetical protein